MTECKIFAKNMNIESRNGGFKAMNQTEEEESEVTVSKLHSHRFLSNIAFAY
jgi:hypothetical protein